MRACGAGGRAQVGLLAHAACACMHARMQERPGAGGAASLVVVVEPLRHAVEHGAAALL
jgi:hypothetical protein